MKRNVARRVSIFGGAAILASALSGGNVWGQGNIEGVYAWTGTRFCISTDGDIDEHLRTIDATFVNSRASVFQFHATFNSDGTGVFDGTITNMQMSPLFPEADAAWVGSFHSTTPFTYTVNPDDNSFSIVNGPGSYTKTAGVGTGDTGESFGGGGVTGQISADGQILNFSDTSTDVGQSGRGIDPPSDSFPRICIRSGSAVKKP